MTDLVSPRVDGGTGYLLSRYAEAMTWLARYMERIENLARILDITETFTRHDGEQGWLALLQINADEERFFARHGAAHAGTVTDFYVLDRDNPSSIAASLTAARENARTLRPLLSVEIWGQINAFYNSVRSLTAADIAPSRLSGLCISIKEACQTHTGICEGTFFRDQGWCFYAIGKYLERADQTTRLVDIKYHKLLPTPQHVGTPLDVGQWHALLRALAGYQAYRRAYPSAMSPATVAGFLLLNPAFPRSLALCVQQIDWHLGQLRTGYGLRADAAMERLDGLRAGIESRTIAQHITVGLHDQLDWVQRQLGLVFKDVADRFWADA